MWIIGHVQSAVAHAAVGVGACVEAAGRSRGAERVSFGSRGPQSSRVRFRRRAGARCSATSVVTRSLHRESTPRSVILSIDTREVAGAREALRGFRGASSGANRVAMRNQSARSAFRRYPESLVWQGRWGSRRGGNVAAGFQPNPTSAGRFRAVDRKR
jgi:spore coat protein U-like protein